MKKFSVRRLLSREGIAIDHGTVKEMADATRIHANTASKYFSGVDLTAVHLDVLSKICEYLDNRFKLKSRLPGALFYDDTVWDTLTDLEVTFFLGSNWFEGESPDHEGRISRHDHAAQSYLASHLAGLKKLKMEGEEQKSDYEDEEQKSDYKEEFVTYYHARKDGKGDSNKDRIVPPLKDDVQNVRALYREHFARGRKLKGNIIIGSQKANLITEMFVAECFGAEPFELSGPRKVPFFLVSRDGDSEFRSCFGGDKPPPIIERGHRPGIHYSQGKLWSHSIEWKEDAQDAGVVLLRHRPAADALDVAIFGFSGRGTYLVARHFVKSGHEFWDFQSGKKNEHIGLYLCEIALANGTVRIETQLPCGLPAVEDEAAEAAA